MNGESPLGLRKDGPEDPVVERLETTLVIEIAPHLDAALVVIHPGFASLSARHDDAPQSSAFKAIEQLDAAWLQAQHPEPKRAQGTTVVENKRANRLKR